MADAQNRYEVMSGLTTYCEAVESTCIVENNRTKAWLPHAELWVHIDYAALTPPS